jgi:hypothetical protein
MILVYYQIKEQELQKDPVIHLELLFKDLSTKTLLLPIKKTKGVEKISFSRLQISTVKYPLAGI